MKYIDLCLILVHPYSFLLVFKRFSCFFFRAALLIAFSFNIPFLPFLPEGVSTFCSFQKLVGIFFIDEY